MYYLYMIKNSFNNLYIGISDNPLQRLHDHNNKKGARYTKFKTTFEIVFLESYETLQQARQREIQLKKWSRNKKEILVEKYLRNLPTKFKSA